MADMKKMDPVVHFEMPAKNGARASKFYQTVFGWDMKDMGEKMGNYILATTAPVNSNGQLEKPGNINGGFFPYDPQKPGFQYPSVVIAVDDIHESIELVKKEGGKILEEAYMIPTVGMFASFEDSEGNRVGMLQPEPMQ